MTNHEKSQLLHSASKLNLTDTQLLCYWIDLDRIQQDEEDREFIEEYMRKHGEDYGLLYE